MRHNDKFALNVRPPILSGNTSTMVDPTLKPEGWSRGFYLGPWQGSFTLRGKEEYLADWFGARLGYHIEERIGPDITWDGQVYELELEMNGSIYRRSLDDMYNAVRVAYSASNGNTAYTDWYLNAASIARYGRRELVDGIGAYPVAAAVDRAGAILRASAWPWPRRVGLNREVKAPELRVTACGYAFTANWRYITSEDKNTGNVDDWIRAVLAADMQFLAAGRIDVNTLQVKRELDAEDVRAWDHLQELAELGDASYNPWRLWVDVGRKVNYEKLPTTPRYYWQNGMLFDSIATSVEVNPWEVRPGVVRDLSAPAGAWAEPGSHFADSRDGWIEQVEASADGGLALTQPGGEYEELIRQQEFYGEEGAPENPNAPHTNTPGWRRRKRQKQVMGKQGGAGLWGNYRDVG